MTDFSTRAVRGPGEESEPGAIRPHSVALYQTSSFGFADAEDGVAAFEGSGAYLYSRTANPTVRALERHIAFLEAAPVPTPEGDRAPEVAVDTRFFASGMAAVSAVMKGVGAGGRIVCQGGIYGTTEVLAKDLRRFGIEVDLVPVADLGALEAAVGDGRPPALVYIETPANPLLQVTDVRAAADIAGAVGALLAVDATFATPALLRPLAWGADLVLHSTTKFMAGHGVVLGGAASGSRELLEEKIAPIRNNHGGAADPFAAWLTLLGLRTLDVRMARHARNAEALAARLRDHPSVTTVHRADPESLPPGQLSSPGAMVSFEVAGGAAEALALIDRLELISLTPTLGNVDTLIQHPWSMSHVVLDEERRRAMGIVPGLLRVSTGLESAGDLIGDLERALDGL